MHSSAPLTQIELLHNRVDDVSVYPFCVPAIRTLEQLSITKHVCFFVGENGTGKSTLLEAIGDSFGFGMQGGSRAMSHLSEDDEALRALSSALRVAWRKKPTAGYFFRTESFFNIATYVDEIGAAKWYGGTSLHRQSHGESFLAVFQHRFGSDGFYLLDEPEAALSPQRQLSFLVVLHELVTSHPNTQFIIATHSPIILAYPNAQIFSFDSGCIEEVSYRETTSYRIASGFLRDPEVYLKHLLE